MIRPILFNTEMVQAIQEGRKTVTRRLAKDLSRPPYETGDVLCVRETLNFLPCITCMERDCSLTPEVYEDAESITEGCFIYKALDGESPVFGIGQSWRPSIHMPKQAERIFLRVEEVRAERLKESINNASVPMLELCREVIPIYTECEACIAQHGYPCCIDNESECGLLDQPRWEFSRLLDSTIPKDKLETAGWAADPVVWVIRFRVCEKPEGWPNE